MDARLQKQYDKELARHERIILALANKRMQQFLKKWGNMPLKLVFGMGTCYIEVNGEQVSAEDYPLIDTMLRDVEELTDNYRTACLEDQIV